VLQGHTFLFVLKRIDIAKACYNDPQFCM